MKKQDRVEEERIVSKKTKEAASEVNQKTMMKKKGGGEVSVMGRGRTRREEDGKERERKHVERM